MQSFTDFDILLSDRTEYLTIFLKDPRTGLLTDVVATSTFALINVVDDSTVLADTFTAGGGSIVSNAGTGVYQVAFNSATYGGEYIAAFRCIITEEILNQNIFVKSASAKIFKYAAELRNVVDKSRKSIRDDIENIDRPDEPAIRLYFGYDDKHLIQYLERGMQYINAAPPYTGYSLDTFPYAQYGTILIDAATIAALEAQGIFAIDTDYDYSLGGNSFTIKHFGDLSAAQSSLVSRFEASLKSFKQLFHPKGAVLFQWSPGGVRDMRYLSSLPSGYWSRLWSGVGYGT